jgi:hypothetical protein
MVLLDDHGLVEAHFGLFGDSVNLSTTYVHAFAPNVSQAWKSILAHSLVLLGDACQVEGYFRLIGDTTNLGA